MDRGQLVNEEIEDGMIFVREFAHYAPVKAAFWVKSADEDQRYLYLSSDRIDDTNFDLAYGEVIRLSHELKLPYLDPFRVKVIGGKDPLAIAAVELNGRYGGTIPTRYGGRIFGGQCVDDVYVYASPVPVAA